MALHFPFEFTLEDGVRVVVTKTADQTYDFSLTPKEGSARHFTFVDDKPRDEVIEAMDFDQLNAVRRFWLKEEE